MTAWQQLLASGRVRPVDAAFARVLLRQTPQAHPLALAGAALASQALAQGHAAFDPALDDGSITPWPDPAQWQQAWRSAAWIDWPDDPRVPGDPQLPLVAEFGLLYLRRYREAEVGLAGHLRRLSATSSLSGADDRLASIIGTLFADGDPQDRQWQAAQAALQHPVLLITGGPGTGKTTTIARILLLHIAQRLLHDRPAPRIALAAPTGRAADRMLHSLQQAALQWSRHPSIAAEWLAQLPARAGTVHRLLGMAPGRVQPHHHAGQPLQADLVVVDEASMLDLPLMAQLAAALADGTRLILLGDRDQLPSVEAGNVLAALDDVAADAAEHADADVDAASPLHAVHLLRNRRQTDDLQLQPLTDAVRRGDADTALQLLESGQLAGVQWLPTVTDAVLDHPLLAPCWQLWRSLGTLTDPAEALAAAMQARLLTALRHGPFGAAGCNAAIEVRLAGLQHAPFHPGRLLQITENSPRHGLFNGDVGICLPDADGRLQAWFGHGPALRAHGLSGLPAHDSAYASTVHKAQGSEFDHVWVLLPPHDARVLGRELLYTALTRARRSVCLLATPDVLAACIHRSQQRVSGLRQRLR